MRENANSVYDFKTVNDGGARRISVFGMGWTGYTLPKLSVADVFGKIEQTEDGIKINDCDIELGDLGSAASFIVWDGDLEAMAHYFYNLGLERGKTEK